MGSGRMPDHKASCLRLVGSGLASWGLAPATLLSRLACSSDTPPTLKISWVSSPSVSADRVMSPASAARLIVAIECYCLAHFLGFLLGYASAPTRVSASSCSSAGGSISRKRHSAKPLSGWGGTDEHGLGIPSK